jgi:hypothetical protein
MWTEGPALPAAAQRAGCHSACRIKHGSEYTAKDRSAVNAADYSTADHATADIITPGDTAANDGIRVDKQEEQQQRSFATAEVGVP